MGTFQIVFNETSSAEMSALPKLLQLEILDEFSKLNPGFLEENPDKFGTVKQGDRILYRYRSKEYRIYFEKKDNGLYIDRVLHKNSLKDFFFRSQIPLTEDEGLGNNPKFWEFIDSSKKK